jgi:uncharacterized protein
MESVGVIRQVAWYPVKSMRGEAVPSANLTLQGIEGDRSYAFVQAASRSDFPWLTAREFPKMLCYKPSTERNGSEHARVNVTTPSGNTLRVESDELRDEIETQAGRSVCLLHNYRGSFDAAPVSLISKQTVAMIAAESQTQEEVWRFRPNLLVDLADAKPFAELQWVGRILRIGETARIAITDTDRRCMIITLDPATAGQNPNVLRSVTQQHAKCAGVYATVLRAGLVRAGDTLFLETS